MTAVIVESSVLIVLLLAFRRLFRNLISMRMMYALWLLAVFSLLPFKALGSGAHSVILNLISRLISLFSNGEFARFDFFAVHLPWYLVLLWALGGTLVFLWEFVVNFKFEKLLFENRVSIRNEDFPYPVYYVPHLRSSCVFKVKGERGIYLQEEILQNPEACRVIRSHEMCHLRAGDLFWAKLRLLFVAVYWFNPLVWIAAFLSKEDCEMSCDERTIALLKIGKSKYGEILLDAVPAEGLRIKDDVVTAATTMVSSGNVLKVRMKRLVAREHNKYVKLLAAGAFVFVCVFLCAFGKVNLHGMDEEETIRQYVYYSNAGYQEGMKRLSLYQEWDYFFPNSLRGEILDIQTVNDEAETGRNDYASKLYKVKMKVDYGEKLQYENHHILLVKKTRADDWKIDWG